jgi:hypothetical protein
MWMAIQKEPTNFKRSLYLKSSKVILFSNQDFLHI